MNKSKCCICGELCSGKIRIRVRKNKDYVFCPFHFNKYERMDIKDIKEKIKENKLLL